MISISSAILLSIINPITYVKRQERIKKLEAIYSDVCCGVKLEKMTLKKKACRFKKGYLQRNSKSRLTEVQRGGERHLN